MKIICIGRNYSEHARELNNDLPDSPMIFMKPSSALLVNNKPFYYPEFSQDIHYETEIVLRIARNGRHVQPEFASEYYVEIGLGIDFTARDLQEVCKKKGHPWEIAKAFDGSAPISSFISKELVDVQNIEFFLLKNGEKVQHGHTKDMIFNFEDIITYASQFFKLHQGDLIFTGTPAGVGPIRQGDVLEGFIRLRDGSERHMLHCEIK